MMFNAGHTRSEFQINGHPNQKYLIFNAKYVCQTSKEIILFLELRINMSKLYIFEPPYIYNFYIL